MLEKFPQKYFTNWWSDDIIANPVALNPIYTHIDEAPKLGYIPSTAWATCLYPPFWVGDDIRCHVTNWLHHLMLPDIFKCIGKFQFDGATIYHSAAMLISPYQQKEFTLKLFNKIMIGLHQVECKSVYMVSNVDLIDWTPNRYQFSINRDPYAGQQKRFLWFNPSAIAELFAFPRRSSSLSLFMASPYFYSKEEFHKLMEQADNKYLALKNKSIIDDDIIVYLLSSNEHTFEGRSLEGFATGFFAMERILTKIWKQKITTVLNEQGLTAADINGMVNKSKDITLNMRIMQLVLCGVLSADWYRLLKVMRKARNNLVHGNTLHTFTEEQVRVLIDMCFALCYGEVNFMEAWKSPWHLELLLVDKK